MLGGEGALEREVRLSKMNFTCHLTRACPPRPRPETQQAQPHSKNKTLRHSIDSFVQYLLTVNYLSSTE